MELPSLGLHLYTKALCSDTTCSMLMLRDVITMSLEQSGKICGLRWRLSGPDVDFLRSSIHH